MARLKSECLKGNFDYFTNKIQKNMVGGDFGHIYRKMHLESEYVLNI